MLQPCFAYGQISDINECCEREENEHWQLCHHNRQYFTVVLEFH